METSQWPLSAASTQVLLGLPPSGAQGGPAPAPQEAFKLGLKELLVRGAFGLQVYKVQWGPAQVWLLPREPVALLQSLAALDGWLRPYTPGEIGAVVKLARSVNPHLMPQIGEWFLFELGQRRLVERYEIKRLGLFSTIVYRRTPSGDAWAATAVQHVQRLQALPYEVNVDPSSAARAAAVAGSLALMVPAALASLAMLRRRSHHHGGDLDTDFLYADDAEGGLAFDPFDGAVGLFDSAIDGGIDAVDAGAGAVDSALEAVAGSVDSAVDSGVDAGGGGGGGDGGGGGGDGGGGGGGGDGGGGGGGGGD